MSAAEPLVDTHCHLVLLSERGLAEQAEQSIRDAGVATVVSVGLDVEDSTRNREIAHGRDDVVFTAGWHPHQRSAPDARDLAALHELLEDPACVAVGEIGLDLFFRPGYHETSLQVQLSSIHAMFELAEQHRRPVILHDRDAHDQILEVMRAHPSVRGVMHCFSGDAGFAQRCVDLGYMISLSGIVTFPRSEPIQEAARTVPADAYVVETDAPFLAPVPHRGRPNLPGYVADTAAAVARLRGVETDQVRRETTANARRLFGLDS